MNNTSSRQPPRRYVSMDDFAILVERHQKYLSDITCRTPEYRLHLEDPFISGTKFGDIDLAHSHFKNVRFEDVDASRSSFLYAHLTDVTFKRSILHETKFSFATIAGFSLVETDAHMSDFSAVRADHVRISDSSSIAFANFERAEITNAYLNSARARSANFSGTRMPGFKAIRVDLNDAVFTAANLNDGEFFASDLSNTKMLGTNLRDVQMTYATIAGADFLGASISTLKLVDTDAGRTPSLLQHPDYCEGLHVRTPHREQQIRRGYV